MGRPPGARLGRRMVPSSLMADPTVSASDDREFALGNTLSKSRVPMLALRPTTVSRRSGPPWGAGDGRSTSGKIRSSSPTPDGLGLSTARPSEGDHRLPARPPLFTVGFRKPTGSPAVRLLALPPSASTRAAPAHGAPWLSRRRHHGVHKRVVFLHILRGRPLRMLAPGD
jgi:hypothetical protein